jgi:AmiR/NasT family two-component response regulator
VLGSLNLYSKRVHGFGEASIAMGNLFSEQAAVALANAKTHASALQLTENLQEALKTREIIGEAKGILMVREDVNEDEAFQMLRRASQTTNMKLRDIAQELVDKVISGDGHHSP